MTHTPAPWRIEQPNESTPHIWITADGDNGGIAKLETCNYDDGLGERHTDQDRANAALIAAAPCLLEACENARLQLKYLDEKYGTATTPAVLLRLEAAINKARSA